MQCLVFFTEPKQMSMTCSGVISPPLGDRITVANVSEARASVPFPRHGAVVLPSQRIPCILLGPIALTVCVGLCGSFPETNPSTISVARLPTALNRQLNG